MAQKIRTVLMGYGLAGKIFHGPSLALLEEFELTVIVTGDPARQAAARNAHPGAEVMGRAAWEALGAARLEDIDLVVLATPPATHAALAIMALQASCAVVVDKPFTITSAQGEELISLARDRGQILTTYQNRRWDGEFLTLAKLLSDGALGEVRRFESRLERWQPVITKEWKANATADDGGGLLFDLGTHLIDQALQLFGPVRRVYGELAARRAVEPAEDDVFVALEHESGVISHLWMNHSAAQKGPRLRVLGSESAYVKLGGDLQESQLHAGMLPGDPDYGSEPRESWGALGHDGNTTAVPTERGNFSQFYALLAAAILDGGPVPVNPADSVAGLRIIEQIRRANEPQAAHA